MWHSRVYLACGAPSWHPIAGNLTLDYEIFSTAGDEDHRLVLHPAEPGSPSERALQQLARNLRSAITR